MYPALSIIVGGWNLANSELYVRLTLPLVRLSAGLAWPGETSSVGIEFFVASDILDDGLDQRHQVCAVLILMSRNLDARL